MGFGEPHGKSWGETSFPLLLQYLIPSEWPCVTWWPSLCVAVCKCSAASLGHQLSPCNDSMRQAMLLQKKKQKARFVTYSWWTSTWEEWPQISPASEPKLLTCAPALCYCPGVHPPKVSNNWQKSGERDRVGRREKTSALKGVLCVFELLSSALSF